jgi:hypothetical protein
VPDRQGISTPAVAVAAVGAAVLWAGLKGVTLSGGLRSLLSGHIPAPDDALVAAGATTAGVGGGLAEAGASDAFGAAVGGLTVGLAAGGASSIADAALKYLGSGSKYLWASANPTRGWDCSGYCNWVIGHDLGLPIPGYTRTRFDGRAHGPTTSAWGIWSGAVTVPEADIRAGDLVVWPLFHMGIALDAETMIHCPGPTGTPAPILGRIHAGRPGLMLIRRVRGA